MSDLPQGWEEATIADVTTAFVSIDPTKAPDQTFRYVDIGSIDNKSQTITAPKTFAGRDAPSRARRVIQTDDTLFSTVRTYLKNIALVPSGLNGELTSTGIAVLRPSCGVDANYLFRWVSSDSFVDELSAAQDGTMYPAVSDDDVATATIPLPPLPEQRRIVTKIDSLTGKSRRARDHLGHIPRLVEKYKQAILAAAFRGDLTRDWRAQNSIPATASDFVAGRQLHAREMVRSTGKGRDEKTAQFFPDSDMCREIAAVSAERILPQDWCWTSIGCVFGVYIGATPSRREPSFWNGNVPWVSSGEVAFCRIAETREMISDKGLARTSTRLHPLGTVLIGMIGEGKTRGQAAILDLPACNNQNCAAIRVSEAKYSAEYVYWYLCSMYEITRNAGAGNNQPALNKDRVQRLLLPLAPPAEAIEIAKLIEIAFAWIDRLVNDAKSARKLIDHLDQAVLAKAFKGELVPQDPTDEPASALLDRIRVERAAAPKVKRGRTRAA
jgi:type I restriction enzyme S subunit